MNIKGLNIELLGHATVMIEKDKTIIIDPFKVDDNSKKADIILITHTHQDHLSIEDIEKVRKQDTVFVAVEDAKETLEKLDNKVVYVKPDQEETIENIKLKTVRAYNIDKFRNPGEPFHPKENNWIGYIIDVDGVKVYHSGDTDVIPEMKEVETDIALLPVGGTYTMTAKEAAQATKELKRCDLAIPIHYGVIVGDKNDAEKFKELAECEVKILL
jgi:L-ascorbate metabolism protein UlaG (beta-lactamase superfamily)